MVNINNLKGNLSNTPWYRTRKGRVVLGIAAIVAVVLVVLFSDQIGELLNLIGSKAALESGSAGLQGTDPASSSYFLGDGYSADVFNPDTGQWETDLDAVQIVDDRLMIQ